MSHEIQPIFTKLNFLIEFVKNSGFFVSILFIYEAIYQPANIFEISHLVLLGLSLMQATLLTRSRSTPWTLFLYNLTAPLGYLIFELLFDFNDLFLGYHVVYFVISIIVTMLIVAENFITKPSLSLKAFIAFSISKHVARLSLIPALIIFGVSRDFDLYEIRFDLVQNTEIIIPFIIASTSLLAVLLGIESGIISFLFSDSTSVKEKLEIITHKMLGKELVSSVIREGFSDLKKTNRSILFMDIRGFTSFTENSSEENLRKMMNLYYNRASDIVHEQNAILVKFAGDEVMAVFKHPTECLNSAQKLRIEICKSLEHFNLSVGIGINSGTCLEGFVGSENLKRFDVFGDMINTCKRIEGLSGKLEIVTTKNGVQVFTNTNISWKKDITNSQVKGKEETIEIYRSTLTNNGNHPLSKG